MATADATVKDPLFEIRRKMMEGDTIGKARIQAASLVESAVESLVDPG